MRTTKEEKIKLLEFVKDKLEAGHWKAGGFTGPQGQKCLVGWLGDRENGANMEVICNVMELLRSGKLLGTSSVARWNDAQTSVEPVLEVVNKAIKILQEDEER